MAEIPEQVYLDAARAFRVAVESAYAAGYGRGRDDEAAGLDLPAWAVEGGHDGVDSTADNPDAGTGPAGDSETLKAALRTAQREGIEAGVRTYCEGNRDIEQCRQVLALMDGARDA